MILLLTNIFHKEKLSKFFASLNFEIEKKIKAQEKKMAKGRRLRFHQGNIDCIKKFQSIVRRILFNDAPVDD